MAGASAELVARFEALLPVVPEATERLMFGTRTCVVDGHMFFGVHRTGLFVKLDPVFAAELLALGGIPFAPGGDRVMHTYYVLPEALLDPETWVRRSLAFALTLPAKKPTHR